MTGVVEVLAAVGSAAASAASTVGTVVAAASPWVSGGLALASAGLQISGGQRQRASLEMQAAENSRAAAFTTRQGELAAQQEEVRGIEQANRVRLALLQSLASQRAAYAAAGLALGEGSPEAVEEETRRQAERELTIEGANSRARATTTRLDATQRAGNLLLEGDLLRERGASAAVAGVTGAGTSLLDYVDRAGNRQPGRTRTTRRAPGEP